MALLAVCPECGLLTEDSGVPGYRVCSCYDAEDVAGVEPQGWPQDGEVNVMADEYPRCEHCGREFAPGVFWPAANYCRTRYLLPVIEAFPGLSAAELAKNTGLEYDTVSKATPSPRAGRGGVYR